MLDTPIRYFMSFSQFILYIQERNQYVIEAMRLCYIICILFTDVVCNMWLCEHCNSILLIHLIYDKQMKLLLYSLAKTLISFVYFP